jgi:hypothetical protein
VATLAGSFAKAFGATGLATLAGLWHDLGKYQPAFQQRIRQETGYDPEAHLEQKPGKQPHAHAGALWALPGISHLNGPVLGKLTFKGEFTTFIPNLTACPNFGEHLPCNHTGCASPPVAALWGCLGAPPHQL